MSSVVLVGFFAERCPGCVKFKENHYSNMVQELSKMGGVKFIPVHVMSPGDQVPAGHHKDLQRFVSWWPSFALFSSANYDNKNSRLDGVVFNGVINKDTGTVSHSPKHPLTSGGVLNWVKDQMKDNPNFKKSAPTAITQGNGSVKKIDNSNEGETYTSTYCQQSFIPYV